MIKDLAGKCLYTELHIAALRRDLFRLMKYVENFRYSTFKTSQLTTPWTKENAAEFMGEIWRRAKKQAFGHFIPNCVNNANYFV